LSRISFFQSSLAVLLLFLIPITSSLANESSALDAELQWLQSERMVFTASKSVERISKSPSTISVITARQIRRMGARDVLDVLRIIPGLGITRNNMWFREIEVRGIKTTFSEKIVFMLDGHNLNSQLTNGGPALVFGRLPVGNIQRIEVIRGPVSALYGANAFLGVVNIITKKGDAINGTAVSIQGGSFGRQQYNVQFGQNIANTDVAINANFEKSNGYDPFVSVDALGANAASLAPSVADTKRNSYNIDMAIHHEDFSFQAKYINKKDGPNFGVINVLNQRSIPRNKSYFLDLAYKHTISDALNVKGRVYRDYFEFDNFWALYPPGAPAPAYTHGMVFDAAAKNSVTGAEFSLQFDLLSNNRIIAGINIEEQKQFGVKTITNYNPVTFVPLSGLVDFSSSQNWGSAAKRRLWSAYAEDIWDVMDHIRLVGSVRYDHYNDFGASVNPKLGITWEVAQGYDVKMMYGTAFRAPTFAEVYNINNAVLNGNPNIKAEKVRTFEMGLDSHFSEHLNAGITFFLNDMTDLISPRGGLYKNTTSVRSQGLEFNGKFIVSKGNYLAGNYTFVNVKNRVSNLHLPDIASNRGNVMLNIALSDRFNIYSDFFMKSATTRASNDSRGRLGGYSLMNMSFIAKNLTTSLSNMELRGSVYNLFNKAYVSPSSVATILGDYSMPGISFILEARYKL